jgi:hypothetical protein
MASKPAPKPIKEIVLPKPGLREKIQPLIVGFVVVPVGYVVSIIESLWHWPERRRRAAIAGSDGQHMEDSAHEKRVKRVAADVKAWAAKEPRPPIRTDRSGKSSYSVRITDKHGAHLVDLHDFNHILRLDAAAGLVTVEPFVTVGELTSFLLDNNLMLEATLEMEDATMGGLALSQGMTTHSHACGLVHDTVQEYEFVTGKGEVIKATETENEDVFRAAGFSHGTLGFLTSLTLRVGYSSTLLELI